MEFDLRPRKIDLYIVGKFISTFFVALLLIIGIVIIFDISERIDDFVDKEAPLRAIIFDYYVTFVPYFMKMFRMTTRSFPSKSSISIQIVWTSSDIWFLLASKLAVHNIYALSSTL